MAVIRGPKIITDGLVLCLDAADRNSYISGSTNWIDLSGNNNNGIITNNPSFSYNDGGNFVFDAVNDYIDCGNGSSINFGTGDFTVEMWITRATSTTPNSRVIAKGGDSDLVTSAGFCFFGNDTGLSFAINPSAARNIISAATYSVGEWFQVVGLIERSSTMRTYKNATFVSSTPAPAGSVSNASVNLNIARNTSGANLYWAGNVAVVRIYNRSLQSWEIKQNFQVTKGRFGL